MDEPLSNLDAKLRVQMRTEIAQIHRNLQTTTIYVTHDQTEAMTMGDRVALMKTGVLQQVGSPQDMYDYPDNIFVAGFIGSPPMNMAVARLQPDAGSGHVLVLGEAALPLPESVLAERPALRRYAGREVAVGIRSEDMEDATLVRDASSGARLRATVTLTEALGSELVVHFAVDAPRVVTEDTKELAKDAHADQVSQSPREDNIFVASFAPRSRVRPDDTIEVVIDLERLHFFDPETSQSIRA